MLQQSHVFKDQVATAQGCQEADESGSFGQRCCLVTYFANDIPNFGGYCNLESNCGANRCRYTWYEVIPPEHSGIDRNLKLFAVVKEYNKRHASYIVKTIVFLLYMMFKDIDTTINHKP